MHKGLSEEAIQGIIRRKMVDWLNSIEDNGLRTFLRDQIIVTGGAIASMLRGDKVNDFDVYLRSQEAARRLAVYYVERFVKTSRVVNRDGTKHEIAVYTPPGRVKIIVQSAGMAAEGQEGEYQYFETTTAEQATGYVERVTANIADDAAEQRLRMELAEADISQDESNASGNPDNPGDPSMENPEFVKLVEDTVEAGIPPKQVGPGAAAKNRYRPIFLSGNAITLSDRVQICIRFFGDPEEIHKNFDFVHCMSYWTSAVGVDGRLGGTLVVPKEALSSLISMKLKYIGSRYPLCSLIRLRKFIRRGWTAPASVFIKPMYQCTQLDWNKISTWEDQLTGVDTAYFNEIISIIKRDQAEGKQIDGAYVIALIDRLV